MNLDVRFGGEMCALVGPDACEMHLSERLLLGIIDQAFDHRSPNACYVLIPGDLNSASVLRAQVFQPQDPADLDVHCTLDKCCCLFMLDKLCSWTDIAIRHL